MRESHPQNLKRISLELGGKSPNIICHDANLEAAVPTSIFGCMLNQGQCCAAGTRIFVHDDIYDAYCDMVVQQVSQTTVGDMFEEGVLQGPQVSKEQMEKVMGYIQSGKDEGATLLCGGNRVGKKGYYIEPTVFGDVTDDMKIAREEIFGPVMQILRFSDYDEVIARANDTSYGLAAGVFTDSIETSQLLTNSLRAGTVWVNCYAVFDCAAPFGGFKDSGIGREEGQSAMDLYTENKTVIVNRGDALP